MNWLQNAIFYEIYPTSFKDTNSDGIGDLEGIIQGLDYVKDLGFNAIWINPFYKSPFKDGGYDVSDFFDVDPRFGTLEDFKRLMKKAKELDIKIILDLVAGHASEENKDFLKSAEAKRNEYSDLFIWNASPWELESPYRLIAGRHDRFGCYMVNFFSVQPAFNFGFNKITHPKWQISYKDEKTKIARDYLKRIIRFWLDLGVDGFRVDMADSLVKNDDSKEATMEIWKEIRNEIFNNEYQDRVLISEWSDPSKSLKCGFDCDFVLDHWDNFYHRLARSNDATRGKSVLHGADKDYFVKDLLWRIDQAREANKYLGLISGNHDTPRISTFLNDDELRLFYLMLFTLPGIPFIYYGDEIKMKHVEIDSKDGGYQRTGDRLPFKWNASKNKGFSDSDGDLYLPLDDENLTVESEMKNPESILNYLKDLIKMRKKYNTLSNSEFIFRNRKDSISYTRGELKVVVNLKDESIDVEDFNELIFESRLGSLKGKTLKGKSAIIYR